MLKIALQCDTIEQIKKDFFAALGGDYEKIDSCQQPIDGGIERINELISKLPNDFKTRHKEINWNNVSKNKIVELREFCNKVMRGE